MGNYISRINKDPFFVYGEPFLCLSKNDFFLSKGLPRQVLGLCAKKECTGALSLMRFSEIIALAPSQTGVWWTNFYTGKKNVFSILKGILNKNCRPYQESTYCHNDVQKKLLSSLSGL